MALSNGQKIITIVTAFDTNYVGCFAAALASIAKVTRSSAHYDFILLVDNVQQSDRDLITMQVAQQPWIKLHFVDMTGLTVARSDAAFGHFSEATFFRLRLTELLPFHDKVIYLDPDLIVLDDLELLFDTDVSNVYAAAVFDYTMRAQIESGFQISQTFGGVTRQDYWDNVLRLSVRAQNNYFNGGVMVLNLAKIRDDGLASQFRDLAMARRFDLVDQDIMNKVFDGRIHLLAPRWNVIPLAIEAMRPLPQSLFEEVLAARRDPAIVHFAGGHLKPWLSNAPDFTSHFWLFARRTAFYERSLQLLLEHSLLSTTKERLSGLESELDSTLSGQRERLSKLEAAFDSALSGQQAQLVKFTTQIESALRSQQERLDRFGTEVSSQRAQLVELQPNVDLLITSLRRVEQTCAELSQVHDQLAYAVGERNAILHSTTWKTTWVIRAAGSHLPLGVRRMLRGIAKIIWWTVAFKLLRKLRERFRPGRKA